jgi:thiamine-phosphate pyrophosphorylase
MRSADHRVRGLYAVTPEENDSARLVEMVEAALLGGARLLQYRNKQAPAELQRAQAIALHAVCRRYQVPLVVNDHPQLAEELGAEGLHLGREDGDVRAARARLPQSLLGVSCYNEVERAVEAARQGADYIAFGRFFASSTKPGEIHASLTLVAEARQRVRLPVVAIGGITLENAPALVEGGVDALAVVAGLFEAPDICARARAFADLYDRA